MTSDHRPFLPQLLVLLREDEERPDEPTPSEEEAKARARTVVRWLQEELLPQVRGGAAVLFAHQTFLDLLLQLLLTGSDNRWTYGMPRHKLSHTGVARVLAHADGRFEQVE